MEELIEYLKKHIEICKELQNMKSEQKVLQLVLNEAEKIAINYTPCCKGEAKQYYCDIHKKEMTYDTNVNEHFCWACEHEQQ